MSRWAKYLGLAIPLLGIMSPWHIVNAAALPLVGGLIYGYLAEKRRHVALSPVAALVPVALVLLYYALTNAARLVRFLEIFPIFALLWVLFWVVFFTMGATAGYILRHRPVKS
ncbi:MULTISPECIES: hypothetical protein [Pyrobaculum]|uniref:Uncharacterized protein n=2 Tax=Pyrobaculum arsenaticum TaxID=121277 RepID=A4WL76_PYRAR|nr:hypothetical protein [Pyrobaculum arsenaticum]ABP51143.1 conserved hypothetical protein [Pyrobaculum arsenaticum DSM 13514]MCY0891620.1 hypothetical protein [Pyrobaculum arsenaticum]NYR15133.1 hypothetical protein [Pyrobaculum arsenaticum]